MFLAFGCGGNLNSHVCELAKVKNRNILAKRYEVPEEAIYYPSISLLDPAQVVSDPGLRIAAVVQLGIF